jgi:pimeloyl-ACP methyl ester carboxylesterase
MGSLSLSHAGCPVAYEVRGDGPPVVFIQGCAAHGCACRPQVNGLADRYRCLSFDNRGIGGSVPAGGPITVEQMADDTRALMDAQGWADAHVVGHSLGGLVAIHLALTAPERARSLALLCTFARGRDAAPPTLGMAWYGLRSRVGTPRMRRQAFLHLVLSPEELAGADPDALAEELAGVFGHDLGDPPPVTGDQLRAMRAYDATPRLAELAGGRVLVASAEHDRIAPPALGRALADGIPGARYVEFTGAAHGLPVRHAERVNALLHEHFAGVG